MTDEIDFSTLSEPSRAILHRRLYQTECRAGLMWLLFGLGCWSYTAPLFETVNGLGAILLGCGVVVYSALLALWTIVPMQKVLSGLRKESSNSQQEKLETEFDNTWSSVKDFLFLALMVFVGLAVWWMRAKVGE